MTLELVCESRAKPAASVYGGRVRAWQHVQVSRVFDSRRRSGVDWFGKEVPALLVYESEGGKMVGIYPRSHKHDPVDTTIVDYLESVSPTPVSWVATGMSEPR